MENPLFMNRTEFEEERVRLLAYVAEKKTFQRPSDISNIQDGQLLMEMVT